MDTFGDANTCRICLKQKNAVYSLFRKQNGIYLHEKLKKVGLKTDVNDIGPSNICCDCLIELDITLKFLEKCEKAKEIFDAQLSRGYELFEQKVSCKHEVCISRGNNVCLEKKENIRELDTETNLNSLTENEEKICDNLALSLEEAKCSECGSHRRCRHWSPPTTHTCPYCQKVFGRKFNFKLHLARHGGSREWWCRSCGARTLSRWLAAAHCAPRPRRACPVPGCGKTYTTNTNLNTHLRVHSGERPFECNECGKKFTSKNTLSDHLRIHTGALPYICPVCGKRFRTNKLSAHMATHSQTRLSCARAGCSLRFTSRRALARHRASHHPANATASAPASAPAHSCALCPAKYHHRQSLNKHVKKQHSQKDWNEGQYFCGRRRVLEYRQLLEKRREEHTAARWNEDEIWIRGQNYYVQ